MLDTIFVFGNRNKDCDYFYSEEWLEFERENLLTVVTAFSRDQVSLSRLVLPFFLRKNTFIHT